MSDQPIPAVSKEDTHRIVLREFGPDESPRVLALLSEYAKAAMGQSSPRVEVAMLKIADGSFDRLGQALHMAQSDYRDVLSSAEYPRYMREIGFSKVTPEQLAEVIAADWKQYSEWFGRE